MKQNVSETKCNWRFRKNVKTCLQNKKAYLMLPSRHGYFYTILILLIKMVDLPQQHANTTVHWLQALPLPVAAKSSIWNVAEFPNPSLKTTPFTKTIPVSCKNQSFLTILKCCHLFYSTNNLMVNLPVIFSATFYIMMISIFDELFRRLLPLSCFYESSQYLFKVKITCKIVSFI